MKHVKEIWQLWGKYFMLLMRETGLTMLIGLLFFSLGMGFVMVKHSIVLTSFSDSDAIAIFTLVGACALCVGMAKLAAQTINDNEDDDDAPARVSKLDQALQEKQA